MLENQGREKGKKKVVGAKSKIRPIYKPHEFFFEKIKLSLINLIMTNRSHEKISFCL